MVTVSAKVDEEVAAILRGHAEDMDSTASETMRLALEAFALAVVHGSLVDGMETLLGRERLEALRAQTRRDLREALARALPRKVIREEVIALMGEQPVI
jgi:hypothetical protein